MFKLLASGPRSGPRPSLPFLEAPERLAEASCTDPVRCDDPHRHCPSPSGTVSAMNDDRNAGARESVSDAKMIFPENFDLLHRGEEFIREQTKKAIEATDVLRRHFVAIEASQTLIDHFARGYAHTGDNQLTIQLLGLRLFNSAAGAVQSLMGGYYQNSIMLQRDLLEVSFLLDYFHSNRALIAEWRRCDESERNKKFSAYKVRTGLDDRDGFMERKREAHYKLLCTLGAHASYQGFELLRPTPGGDARCGPYFAERALDATAAELAKVAVGAATNFTPFFDAKSLADWETKLRFMEAQVAWFEYFFGPFNKGQLDQMRKVVAHLKAAQRG